MRRWLRQRWVMAVLCATSCGCQQSSTERSAPEFVFDQTKVALRLARQHFEKGYVALNEEDATYGNAGAQVNVFMARVVSGRVKDAAKRKRLAPKLAELKKVWAEQVAANVEKPEPDFQAGIAGIDQCIKIIEQMEAILRE